MKLAPVFAAVAFATLSLPAMAQGIARPDGTPISIGASAPSFSSVTVFGVADYNGLILDHDLGLKSDQRVADAITRAGYTGSQIIGYELDGSSLTVYVKTT